MNDTENNVETPVEKPSFFRRVWAKILTMVETVKAWFRMVWVSFVPGTIKALIGTTISAIFVTMAVVGLWYFGYYSWLVMAVAVLLIALGFGTRLAAYAFGC